jgi:hypothetical protein
VPEVVVKLLPDGSGRVCIHWLMHDPEGPIQTINASIPTAKGPVLVKGRRFRCACQPQLSNMGGDNKGRLVPFVHSDDPRAATCPKCCATKEYKEIMARLEQTLIPRGV